MAYCKIVDGKPVPYTRVDFRRDYPNVSLPENPTAEALEPFGVYILQQENRPVIDEMNYRFGESVLEMVDGVPTKRHSVVELNPAEKVRAQKNYDNAIDRNNVERDTQVKALLDARPAQIDTWVENNVTDLASAKQAIAVLAKAVSVLYHGRLK